MGRDKMLVFVRGVGQPVLAERLVYHADRRFAALWDCWRDCKARELPLMIEHKPLRIG